MKIARVSNTFKEGILLKYLNIVIGNISKLYYSRESSLLLNSSRVNNTYSITGLFYLD